MSFTGLMTTRKVVDDVYEVFKCEISSNGNEVFSRRRPKTSFDIKLLIKK